MHTKQKLGSQEDVDKPIPKTFLYIDIIIIINEIMINTYLHMNTLLIIKNRIYKHIHIHTHSYKCDTKSPKYHHSSELMMEQQNECTIMLIIKTNSLVQASQASVFAAFHIVVNGILSY